MSKVSVKEITKWLKSLEENKWRKSYHIDAKRIMHFINLGEDVELPKSIARRSPNYSYSREKSLAKRFLEMKEQKQMNESKLNETTITVSGTNAFITKKALPFLKKAKIKNVKLHATGPRYMELSIDGDKKKLDQIDAALHKLDKSKSYSGVVESKDESILIKTIREIIQEELQNLNEVGWNEMLDLDKTIGDKKLNKVIKGKKYEGEKIASAYFADMQKNDVCNPLDITFGDGSDERLYGYDVLAFLDKFKIKYPKYY